MYRRDFIELQISKDIISEKFPMSD